ncbi:MAG: tetratricopeptide repeat protein [Chloroflexota bacterium]|nr:MAG: hypothetical protein DIU68_19390 [Chloroflexota bacterium]
MAFNEAKSLRLRGIEAAKRGSREEARLLLQQAIRLDPQSEPAWIWLASVVDDPRERIFCLEKTLELNPHNETALRALAALQGKPVQQGPAIRPLDGMKLQSSSPSAGEILPSTPSVPVPSAEQIAEAQRQAEAVIGAYLATSAAAGNVRWVHKMRRRAGENDILVLRAQVAAAIIAFLIVLGGGGALFVLNNEDARAVLFAPTPTATYTPTMTATPTPGLTPTPSPTPRLTLTPSPTVPPALPTYDPYFPPRPTEIFPRVESVPLRNAVALIDSGQAVVALPTLAAERAAVSELFNPAPYYFEAMAFLKTGNTDAALRALDDAESRLNPSNTGQYKPVIDTGYAIVYAEMAREAAENGSTARLNELTELAAEHAEEALARNRANVDAYLALAETLRLKGDLTDALTLMDEALQTPELVGNPALLTKRGQLNLELGRHEAAIYDAYVALLLNAETEAAHILRTEAALAQGKPGLAVLYAQAYLFYYPGSPTGWKLLGDARAGEGNRNAALAAYTQALAPDTVTEATSGALLGRAEIYRQQRRYDLALDDLTRAFNLLETPEVQAQRMRVASLAGAAAIALADAEALDGTGLVPEAELDLLRARLMIDTARAGDTETYNEALGLLLRVSDLPQDQMALAQEYIARAHYALGNYQNSLTAVNLALETAQNAGRRFLRAQVLEALGREDEAARDYEWVLAWSEIYPLSYRLDAEERLAAIREL